MTFRPIPQFPAYSIDEHGRIRHERSSKFLTPTARGYVKLYNKHGPKQIKVETLKHENT